VGSVQLLAGIQAAALAAQPLAVEEMGAGRLGAEARLVQVGDRVAVELLGGAALAEQGADEGLDPQDPFGGRYPGASRCPDPTLWPRAARHLAGYR